MIKNTIKIKDRIVEYSVEYRKVKYTRYELKYGKLRVIIPKRSRNTVEEEILKKEGWIYNKLSEYDKQRQELSIRTKDMKLEQRSLSDLKQLVVTYVEEYESFLDVKINRLQFRDTVYKWGSCTSLKNITLSKNLRYLPDKLVAYIVYHELAHIIVLAHDDKFFEIIKRKFPDYKQCDEKLKEYQFLIVNMTQ